MQCKFPILLFPYWIKIACLQNQNNDKNSQLFPTSSILHRVAIVKHWKKQHIHHYKRTHLLNPTTTTDRLRLRVPKLFPQLFQQLEAALYTSAPTKELYMDKNTLQKRLLAVSVRNTCFGRLEARSWTYFLQMGKNAYGGCCEWVENR